MMSAGLSLAILCGMAVNQYVSINSVNQALAVVDREQTILDGISGSQLVLANMMNIIQVAKTSAARDVDIGKLKEEAAGAAEGLATPIKIAMKPDVLIDIRDGLQTLSETVEATERKNPNSPLPEEEIKSIVVKIRSAIESSVSNARKFTAAAKVDLENRVSFSNTMAYSFMAGIILVLILSSLFLIMTVVRPIRSMTQIMQKLAEGDTSVEIGFAERRDEVGQMAGAIEIFRQAAVTNKRLEVEAETSRRSAEATRIADQQRAEADAAERMREATSGLAAGLKRLAAGDLSFQLDQAFSAEFEGLRIDFNTSIAQLAETLATVSRSVTNITTGSQEISGGANDLSKRTEQQAAALEETAAALDQITANVSLSSKRSEEARQVAEEANASAARSGEIVDEAVDAMSRIKQSSSQISNIIGVIDEIAFQTNLLALNAGVEAARAGDAGKGFAVVAQEVRELAQRSAQAAKEIKGLIQTSSSEVENGVKLVSETGAALRSIGELIVSINGHMQAIATSSREQSTGLAEVNTAVNQMDQTTQQNAAMVEETSAAAGSLATEADKLREMISQFNLGSMGMDASQSLRRTAALMARPASGRNAAPAEPAGRNAPVAQAAGRKLASGSAAQAWSDF
ncbi:HAMP domain-containing methyl-accepting chemotaxis protein [Rhizobium sp. SSA_523]|uniref:methyl-accepting chemotaxis protein n=1 Tax=Rhizobium sp. SSA_523 TaxID=2952477 RepID=UPI002090DAC0|nr:HAMP domain-containing methyl-accepting chemotaxis protein [Rhizobium sp. SSA_523]MCO5731965.1 HAMP domain-containing methyl-accepting chemotaxis protein [Rhizobium sp. SSA_523]WKC22690.1 HAMP domain-containing methyl-accepting chemotaxis protein [Rhizobium sp. SSA_523]